MRHILRHTKKIIILVVGLTVIGIGIALLVLPGPGIVVVIAGLAILATEFAWAQGLLDRAKMHYQRAKQKVTKDSPSSSEVSRQSDKIIPN
jgi:uncharacterized protein (TIGR02611 family)